MPNLANPISTRFIARFVRDDGRNGEPIKVQLVDVFDGNCFLEIGREVPPLSLGVGEARLLADALNEWLSWYE